MMKITRQTHTIPSARHTRIQFIILSMLIVLLGATLTFLWQEQRRQISLAAGEIVVGPPSLSAATVDALFRRLGSPMAGTGEVVEKASRNTNIDDAFALAVWWAETNDGMAGVGLGYRNPGGVQASYGYARYPSYAAAVEDWFNVVHSHYISRGLTSVYSISGPYVGTSGALNWANKVINSMASYRASSPHPNSKASYRASSPHPNSKPAVVHTLASTPKVVVQTPVPTPKVVVQPKTDTHVNSIPQNKSQPQQLTQPAASTKSNANTASNTQLLLTGTALLVVILLAVPGLLIYSKRRTRKKMLTAFSMPNLTFEPQPTTNCLPVTTTLRMEAISAQQLKPHYKNQYWPVAEGEAVNAINTSKLALEFDALPALPASRSLRKPLLQPVAAGNQTVPPTPLQRVPATPFLQSIPATPLLSQDGLITRYNTQSRPRRIALIRPADRTN